MDFIKNLPGKGVSMAHHLIRQSIPTLTKDRIMADDILSMEKLISNEAIIKEIEKEVGTLN